MEVIYNNSSTLSCCLCDEFNNKELSLHYSNNKLQERNSVCYNIQFIIFVQSEPSSQTNN